MNAPIVVGGKSPHSRPIQNRKPHGRSRLTNKKDLLPGVDGRTVVYRRFRDIASQVALDQGGLDQLSEARLQLVRRFAAAAVLAEQLEAALANGQEINIAEHGLLCSTLVRIAQRIGINRVPRDVSLTLADILRENEGDAS
ncbi:MAG: hypothetical protein WCC54_27525 [Pseudolabrys sp.]|jgi:hypothetical protein